MNKILVQRISIVSLATLLTVPVIGDSMVPEKATVQDIQSLLYYLDRAFPESPTLALPYIRALADSDYPEKLAVLRTYYDIAAGFPDKMKRFIDPQVRALREQGLSGVLDILEANIRLVEAEQQTREVARRIYVEMVNDERRSLAYRAEALRRLEDDPPKELAKSLPNFLPDWEETLSGRRYHWKVHPSILARVLHIMRKVCGKEVVPLLDNWLRGFAPSNGVERVIHMTAVDVYWDLRLAGVPVQEQIKIATDELLDEKGFCLTPAVAFVKIGKPSVPTLIELLYIPENRINGSAEWALAKIKDERAIEHLARVMDDPTINPTPIFKCHTIWAIGQIGGTKAAVVLKQLLKRQNEHPFVISEALKGLGNIGDQSAEELILPFLEHTERFIRYSASNALKTCGTQKAVPFLLRRFEVEPVHTVKIAIADALKALGVSVDVEPVPPE